MVEYYFSKDFFKTPMKYKAEEKDVVYLKIASTIAELSRDENTQVGSVIIDKFGKVVSLGYNGAASGIDRISHSREERSLYLKNNYDGLFGDLFEEENFTPHKSGKSPFMLHAEQNALLTCSDNNRLFGATIYVTHYPCNVCANMIAQCGITSVKVLDNRYSSIKEDIKNTLYIFEQKKIELHVFKDEKL